MIQKNKLVRISIIIIAGILFILIGAFAALNYGNRQDVSDSSGGDILAKLQVAELGDGTAIIEAKDLNALLGLYKPSELLGGVLKIKAIGTSIENDTITVKAPAKVKGISILLRATFAVGYTEQSIKLAPVNFKVGLVTIPKSMAMNKLKRYSGSRVKISDSYIDIVKNFFPIQIEAVSIKGDKLMLMVKKQREIGDILVKIDEFEKKKQISGSTEKQAEDRIQAAKSAKEKRTIILTETLSQLDRAATQCKTAKERKLISMAKEVIRKMISDENYPYMNEYDRFKKFYNSMSGAEMQRIEAAVLEHVDTKALMQIQSIN